jgi:hypothetical protein
MRAGSCSAIPSSAARCTRPCRRAPGWRDTRRPRALQRVGAAPSVRAHHLAHAARPGGAEAAATLRAAAAVVRPRAPAIAADWLLAARRADPSFDPAGLAAPAEVLVEAARLTDARGVVEEARAASAANDDELLARLAVIGAAIERLLGQHDAARRRLERTLDRAPQGGPVAARLMTELAYSAYQQTRYPDMTRWAERARATPGCEGVVRAAAAAMLATGRAFAGEREAAEEELAVALGCVEAASDEELATHPELAVVVPWALLVIERVSEGLAVCPPSGRRRWAHRPGRGRGGS